MSMDAAWISALTEKGWILPNWFAPASVRAVMTTRLGGVSQMPFASLNLGDHVNDEPHAVAQNRQIVTDHLRLPSEPLWLQQVHGTVVASLPGQSCVPPQADASVAFHPGTVCVVMTADCLPVLFCDCAGTRVAAAHAGWRGLCDGVLEATVQRLDCNPADLLVWLGAAIGPDAFEVGEEVREAFIAKDARAAKAFKANQQTGKWLADIYMLARQRLQLAGLKPTSMSGGNYCTFQQSDYFFSYRRDGQTGRMASLIYLLA